MQLQRLLSQVRRFSQRDKDFRLRRQAKLSSKYFQNANLRKQKNQSGVNRHNNFGEIRPLWEPFRAVLSEDELSEQQSVVENNPEEEGRGPAARFWGVWPDEAHERIADAVTPLWRLDYPRQLEVKQARVRALLRQLTEKLGQTQEERRRGLSYQLDRILPAPQIDGYRNKEEYKIGEGADGDPKTVGFIFSSPARGPALVLPGDQLRNCKPQHARVARAFQQFVRSSPLRACSRLDDGGHWRLLLVRSDRQDRTLASVTFHPQQLPAAAVEAERQRLRQFFTTGAGSECDLQSLFFQECRHARCSSDQAPYQVLFGPAALEDRLGPVRFLVSPGSFFQVNAPAAETLYDVVRRRAGLTPATVLLDLCSGTGPVSLLMAPHCRLCIGIETTPSSVRDAMENARINGISNVEFITGRVEQELPRVTRDLELCTDLVAVLNPGRDGVAPRVIDQLRATPALRRVIYIACKADHRRTAANLASLCRPGPPPGRTAPFRLTRITPVDLFPHTDHLELVLTFER